MVEGFYSLFLCHSAPRPALGRVTESIRSWEREEETLEGRFLLLTGGSIQYVQGLMFRCGLFGQIWPPHQQSIDPSFIQA
jgi:hypothetical protein